MRPDVKTRSWWQDEKLVKSITGKTVLFATHDFPAPATVTAPLTAYRHSPESALMPKRVSGYAMPWDVLSTNVFTSRDGIEFRDKFKPGAFNRSLAAIREGRLEVPLLKNHYEHGRKFLYMHDPGVMLRDHAGGLFLSVDVGAGNFSGQALHEWMALHPSWRFLSCCYVARGYEYQPLNSSSTKMRVISDADLIEISLGEGAGMGEEYCNLEFNYSPLDL